MTDLFGMRRSACSAREILHARRINFTPVRNRHVATCVAAAAARQIPLRNELKSLLLVTDDHECVLVNIPGDNQIDRRLVKTAIGCKKFRFASGDEMKSVNMSAGTVNPFDIEGCRLFYDVGILELEYIGTNDGAHNSGVLIGVPELLLAFPGTVTKLSSACG